MRYNSLIRILTFIIFFSGIFGCAKRNLVYFSDIETGSSYSTNISQVEEPVIQSGDLIKIVVSTQSPESNLLFNSGVISNDSQNRMMNQQLPTNEGYLVDKNGQINFPVLGKIEIAGFTREEATIKMTELLEEYVKDPIINIQYLNFKITVIGEVANPNTFTLATDRISILEALGLAGDMTQYGKRENVLLIQF